MLTSIAFDTRNAVRALRGAGVDERQAEAFVQVVKPTADLPDASSLATKSDLALLEGNLERRSGR